MALTPKQCKDVCMLGGQHLQCRYLDEDYNDQRIAVYVCKKLSPDKAIIDGEVDDYLDENKKSGQDPTKQGVPLGDNCPGYIKLLTKPQGYDAK